jgi:hypothetical protein
MSIRYEEAHRRRTSRADPGPSADGGLSGALQVAGSLEGDPKPRDVRAPFIALLIGLSLLASCRQGGAAVASAIPAIPGVVLSRVGSVSVELVSAYDLPREDPRSRELSGIAWDASSQTLFAVSDTVPTIVPLRPSSDFRTWSFGPPVPLVLEDAWDGEGIALTPDGFLIANEHGPHIYAFDRGGRMVRELALPSVFAQCVKNKALESLSLTPDGRYMFTANESTLLVDEPQPSATEGAMVRVLRHDLATGEEAAHAYRTEPIFAVGPSSDIGVSDVLALSLTNLLVMERSYVPGTGNSIRVYRTTFEGFSVLGAPSLTVATPVMKKTLFFDFASLPGAELAGRGLHHFPNYEGLALGPIRSDGRRTLFVVSDDNGNPELVARVLVLAVRGLP